MRPPSLPRFPTSFQRICISALPAVLAIGIAAAKDVNLPEKAPVPESRDANQPLPGKGDPAPTPAQRPAEEPGAPADAVEPDPGSEEETPDGQEPAPSTPAPGSQQEKKEDTSALPADELACRADLHRLGVVFAKHDPVAGSQGCAVPHPVVVTSLSEKIDIEPPALLNCRMALAAARFMQEEVAPAARETLNSPLVAVHQVSAYVCRPRAGTETVSEHAFGNALDVAGFTLADGRDIDVRAHGPGRRKHAAFLMQVRMKACGPFTTVLGPGTNFAHRAHFHFDLEERRNAATYCQ